MTLVTFKKIIQDYQIDQLVAEVNQGLAANINKGIVACQEFIVYCQEDFILNLK
jgi:hypothetical protein